MEAKTRRGGEESTTSGVSISKRCYDLWFQLMVFCALIFTFIALPPILLVLSIIYLFRFIVFHSSGYFRPDLGKMLCTRSSIFGSDNIYSKPLCSLVGKHIYEGDFDLNTIREKIQENWIDAKSPDGTLRNPELVCGVTKWLGFLFWKPDPNFRLQNHVNLLKYSDDPEEIITDTKLNSIISTMISKPFEPSRSPWEIWVVPNYVPEEEECDSALLNSKIKHHDKSLEEVDGNFYNYNNNNNNNNNKINNDNNNMSDYTVKINHNNNNNNGIVRPRKFVILIHWNHSLMDGLSVCKLYLNFTNSSIQSFFPKPSRTVHKSECAKFLSSASFIIRAPYQSIKTPLESIDFNSWHLKESELTKKMDLAFTPKIPLSIIQEIRNTHNVSFNGVVFSLLTGAVRNFMLKSNRDKNLPEHIHCGIPYPFPNHPEKLRNHMTFCTVKLPVGTSDSLKRLHLMDKHLKSLKKSTVPIMAFLIMPFVGGLFDWMLKILVKNRSTTCMFSNMPGPKYEVKDSMDLTLKDTMFGVGFGPGQLGIAFTAASYNNSIRFGSELDIAFSTRKLQAKDLAAAIVEELEVLKNCTASQEV